MSRRLLKLLSFFLAGALVLVACGDDDGDSEDAATTEAPAETTEAPTETTVAEPTMDIVETAIGRRRLHHPRGRRRGRRTGRDPAG